MTVGDHGWVRWSQPAAQSAAATARCAVCRMVRSTTAGTARCAGTSDENVTARSSIRVAACDKRGGTAESGGAGSPSKEARV